MRKWPEVGGDKKLLKQIWSICICSAQSLLSNKNIINHLITSENPYLNSEGFVHPLFYFLSGQSGQKKMDIDS